MTKELLEKIKSGDASAAELNVARAFLRDNGINAAPTGENGLKDLHDALPFASPENVDRDLH
ncbi:MAG: hypothetical protein ACWGQW_00050 [bacterium]